MNLRHIAYALGTTIASVSMIVACSSSSSSGTTNTGTDSGAKTDGGTGGGNDGSTGGGNDGSTGGGGCKLNDGTYKLDIKAMNAADYDGGSCMDSSSMFDIPSDGGAPGSADGCMTSADGCMITCDSTSDNAGYTTATHTEITIGADGNGYTGTLTIKTTQDEAGGVLLDCNDTLTATKQ